MLFRIAFGLFCLVGKVLGQMLLPQPGSMSTWKAAVKCSKRHVTVSVILVHILTYVLKSSYDVRIQGVFCFRRVPLHRLCLGLQP